MKNRLKLITALVLALTLSGGVYAYTFSTASGTINIAEPTGDIATCNATETELAWEDILIPVADTVIFRPNAAGDETNISSQYPATGEHWDKVYEETSDGNSTYVASNNSTWEEDLYDITDHSTQTAAGTINYVKVYMVCRTTTDNVTQSSAYVHIKTNGAEDNGAEQTLTSSYAPYSYQWDTNPQTSANWTWDEIDALQIGVGIRQPNVAEYTRVTQVYAEVGFEAPPLSGNVPTGNLFTVTPNADYTGDLSVKVYLANTGNLTRAYQYLSMELYLEGSEIRLLTLENGVATFWLDNAGSDNRTLSVTGGTYTLMSREPLEWEADWTVIPELYCEVTQR